MLETSVPDMDGALRGHVTSGDGQVAKVLVFPTNCIPLAAATGLEWLSQGAPRDIS